MPAYQFTRLTNELIFIKWFHNPDKEAENDFLQTLSQLLDESVTPLYFISDLRAGRIINVPTISRMSMLTRHEQWGGSTAFSQDPESQVFAGTFRSLSRSANSNNEIHQTPEESLAFLEALKPGITEGIKWEKLISSPE